MTGRIRALGVVATLLLSVLPLTSVATAQTNPVYVDQAGKRVCVYVVVGEPPECVSYSVSTADIQEVVQLVETIIEDYGDPAYILEVIDFIAELVENQTPDADQLIDLALAIAEEAIRIGMDAVEDGDQYLELVFDLIDRVDDIGADGVALLLEVVEDGSEYAQIVLDLIGYAGDVANDTVAQVLDAVLDALDDLPPADPTPALNGPCVGFGLVGTCVQELDLGFGMIAGERIPGILGVLPEAPGQQEDSEGAPGCQMVTRANFAGQRNYAIQGDWEHSATAACNFELQEMDAGTLLRQDQEYVSGEDGDCTYVPNQNRCHGVTAAGVYRCDFCNGKWLHYASWALVVFPGQHWTSAPEDDGHWVCGIDDFEDPDDNRVLECVHVGEEMTLQ